MLSFQTQKWEQMTVFTNNCLWVIPEKQEFNSLPCENILDQSKVNAFTDDQIHVSVNLKFHLGV